MSQENVGIVRAALDAYTRRDFVGMRALNHSDMELDWSASRGLLAGVYRGLDEVFGLYRDYFATFEEVVVEPERFIESGDSVIVPNTAQVRGRDGIETVARSALVFEVRDGLIGRICLYQEAREALEAFGLSE
jgi:ketosteroid isomerase-like protein